MPLPLEGYKVIDFSVAIFGSMNSMMLGDMGADVIKVEPLEGDFMRISTFRSGDGARFMSCNRSKRSLAVNLKDDRGKEMVWKLLKDCDVVIQNFRPGVMERMGFGYKAISAINPRVIMVSQYGYGETGPLAHRMGGDLWAQAMGGVVALQGSPSGPPYIGGVAWADHGGGVLATMATLSAILARERYGVGQEVTLNLLDTVIHMQSATIADWLVDGRLLKKSGRGWGAGFPYGAYPCKDGDIVTIMGRDDIEWPVLCKLLDIEWILEDKRYETHMMRLGLKDELYPILDEAFKKKTRAEWVEAFRKVKLRVDPALDYKELFEHPQVYANDMVIEQQHAEFGKIRLTGIPYKLKGTPLPTPQMPPPLLGQHTREIMRSLGYPEETIQKYWDEGVVGITEPPASPAPR